MYERAFWSVTKYTIFHLCCLCKKINVIVLESVLPPPAPSNLNLGSVERLSTTCSVAEVLLYFFNETERNEAFFLHSFWSCILNVL